ncbi:Zinc finger, C2H2 domain and Zinc finger C2H2-type/integrase DNA-binding domain-containing protein [Aphelenchoides bicaudatus]|nr:Zinc finger, C2H2 domain and Zinc finger C2H2-type/integrase DNA-binding domain-containing protein [Aphelenchoides bicaudatus]
MFGGGNDLLLQSFLSTPANVSIRPQQSMNPFLLGSQSPVMDSQNPFSVLQANFQQQLLLNTLAPSQLTPQQQLLNQLQFQLMCRQPSFIEILSQLTGAKLGEVREVREMPEERHEKMHEKVTPEPIPSAPSSVASRKRTASSSPVHGAPKKSKALRKLHNADTETKSPVSGMHIKDASEVSADDMSKACDLDETASCVNVSNETRRKIAEIPNIIGDSACCLCKRKFPDVFVLAMHRCPRIVHEEYKCPECQKVFSCPANLASHRRWHLPRNSQIPCNGCSKTFDTKKALREHKCLISSRNSIASTNMSSPTTSLTESTDLPASVSPSELFAHMHSPQPALISLGLNTKSLQFSDLHPHFKFETAN